MRESASLATVNPAVARATLAQRKAADPEATVWVAASAGSGKTKVLTDRVLTLLLQGTAASKILCLTFTKAAAAEMAGRLSSRLANWTVMKEAALRAQLADLLGQPPNEAQVKRARELFAAVLDAPGGMKIQTIHAFCQSLLGRFPLEASVQPHAQALDESEAAELLELARLEVLNDLQDDAGNSLDEEVATLTAYANEITFSELVSGIIGNRGRLKNLLQNPMAAKAMLYREMGLQPSDTEESLLTAACDDAAFEGPALRIAARAMLASASKKDNEHGQWIADWLAHPGTRARDFDLYLQAFFTKAGRGSRLKTLIHKAALEAAPGSDLVLEREAERLEAARENLNAVIVAGASAALIRLGAAIQAVYERKKRLRAQLDYDDLILLSRNLLERSGVTAWVLYKLDGGLEHVLIDEAQDTNPDQWKVIELLTAEFFAGESAQEGPRTVFAVGDAKQSIYSFQRADPHEFARMQKHFAQKAEEANLAFEPVPLDVSFRSTTSVLSAVDAVFSDPDAQDGVLFGEEEIRHIANREGQAGLVELWPPAQPDAKLEMTPWALPLAAEEGEAPQARLAKLIAKRIWHWTLDPAGKAAPETRLDSQNRRMHPGDILILVRRRNSFVDALVRALKGLDVPVAGVDRMVLTEQLAVMDLIALGHVMLLPEDDLNLAAVLKGPFFGLSEEQLFRLAYDREGSLWQSLGEQAREGSDDKICAACTRLEALLARADFQPPYEFYADVLGPGRGREALLERLGSEVTDPIDEFLSLALAYESDFGTSLQGFLHWIELAGQEIKRDMEHGNEAVRIMTVHGAKGLQAPVVILPDSLQTPPNRPGLLWLSPELPVWPIATDYDCQRVAEAREAAKRARDQEYRRLLYVAMTRAEDRLYVCGWKGERNQKERSWYAMVSDALAGLEEAGCESLEYDFGEEIKQGWSGPGWRLQNPQVADSEIKTLAVLPSGPVEPLPDWVWQDAPPEPTPPRPLVPSRPSALEPSVQSPLGSDDGRRFRRGRLIHRLLQTLPDLDPDLRKEAAQRYLACEAADLPIEFHSETVSEVLRLLGDPTLADLFGPDSQAEVPVVGVIETAQGPETLSGQIDRLVVSDSRVRIVDFKTNRPPPEKAADVPVIYLRQLAAYRAALQRIYPDKSLECLLLWTDGPHLMQISDAQLANLLP